MTKQISYGNTFMKARRTNMNLYDMIKDQGFPLKVKCTHTGDSSQCWECSGRNQGLSEVKEFLEGLSVDEEKLLKFLSSKFPTETLILTTPELISNFLCRLSEDLVTTNLFKRKDR